MATNARIPNVDRTDPRLGEARRLLAEVADERCGDARDSGETIEPAADRAELEVQLFCSAALRLELARGGGDVRQHPAEPVRQRRPTRRAKSLPHERGLHVATRHPGQQLACLVREIGQKRAVDQPKLGDQRLDRRSVVDPEQPIQALLHDVRAR